mmetsp:Transcript_9637/g.11999  ORF Transcript_9637/g.11999 Transcript_9637/m.11999 type:complete len:326 (-) Transcript_9637:366-1343(-)
MWKTIPYVCCSLLLGASLMILLESQSAAALHLHKDSSSCQMVKADLSQKQLKSSHDCSIPKKMSTLHQQALFSASVTTTCWSFLSLPSWGLSQQFPAELDTLVDGEINNVKAIAEQPQLLEIFGLVYSDVLASLLWAYVLFFGLSEDGRPADWLAERIAPPLGLGGEWLEDQKQGLAVEKPLPLLILLQILFLGLGVAMVQGILLFFDADHFWPWSFGACAAIGSFVYEIGRPQKLTREESERAEAQWNDFLLFASDKLQRKGQCHQSKIINAFRRYYAQYRTEEQISTIELERLIRRWHSGEPPRQGFYRGLSLQEPPTLSDMK